MSLSPLDVCIRCRMRLVGMLLTGPPSNADAALATPAPGAVSWSCRVMALRRVSVAGVAPGDMDIWSSLS